MKFKQYLPSQLNKAAMSLKLIIQIQIHVGTM